MIKSKLLRYLGLLAIGCALAIPVAVASLTDFVANLEADLDGRCTGHAYVVFQNGALAAAGSGGVRIPDDNLFINSYPFTIHTRKGCHSMSKTITAAAILDALQEKGFDIDRKISADFPEEFKDKISDNRIHLVTYRDLLRHESGWPEERSFKASWNDVKEMIGDGLESPPPALELGISNGYSNRTYGLLRILLSSMLSPELYENPFPPLIPYLPSFSSSHYFSRVQQRLLLPAGVLGATTGPIDDPETNPDYNFAKYHYFLNPGVEPRIMEGYKHHAGGFGWAMSTLEFGLFISKLFNNTLIAGSCVNTMKSDRLGMGFNSTTNSFGHTGSHTLSNSAAGRCGWVPSMM